MNQYLEAILGIKKSKKVFIRAVPQSELTDDDYKEMEYVDSLSPENFTVIGKY